jgi:hypothetical protein
MEQTGEMVLVSAARLRELEELAAKGQKLTEKQKSSKPSTPLVLDARRQNFDVQGCTTASIYTSNRTGMELDV